MSNNSDTVNFDVAAHFERAATAYEKYGGDFTRSISRHLISIAQPVLNSDSIVLDNACGPGITSSEIVRSSSKVNMPKEIYATDFSPAMIRELEKKGHKEIQGAVMDSSSLTFEDEKFSHIFFAFAIFALPDATKGARELYRCLRSGGSAYVTTWAELGWTPPVNRALKTIKPDAPDYIGPLDPRWLEAEKLKEVLVSGGFVPENVEVHRFDSKHGSDGWTGVLGFLENGIMAAIAKANGFDAEQTKAFEAAVVQETQNAKDTRTDINMPAWVGVARKT